MTVGEISQARWLLSSLLIAGAALFAIGVAAERSAADTHTEATDTEHSSTEHSSTEESSTDEESSNAATSGAEPSKETLFGVDLESTALVIVAAAASLALAVLTWRSNARLMMFATVAFTGVFAALDMSEFVHQIKESRAGIAALAAVVAGLHIAAALVAEQRAATSPA